MNQPLSFSVGREATLTNKIQRLCGIPAERSVDYRKRRDIESPLYHFSTEVMRACGKVVGFVRIGDTVPRFSGFLEHPEKASAPLERELQAAKEQYSDGRGVAVIFGDEKFVYSDLTSEFKNFTRRCSLCFENKRRPRCVMTLKSFLVALGVSEEEDDA